VNNVTRLARHAIETLPDSIRARRELLEVVVESTPLSSPERQAAAQLLYLLVEHEKLQRELPLAFTPGGAK